MPNIWAPVHEYPSLTEGEGHGILLLFLFLYYLSLNFVTVYTNIYLYIMKISRKKMNKKYFKRTSMFRPTFCYELSKKKRRTLLKIHFERLDRDFIC